MVWYFLVACYVANIVDAYCNVSEIISKIFLYLNKKSRQVQYLNIILEDTDCSLVFLLHNFANQYYGTLAEIMSSFCFNFPVLSIPVLSITMINLRHTIFSHLNTALGLYTNACPICLYVGLKLSQRFVWALILLYFQSNLKHRQIRRRTDKCDGEIHPLLNILTSIFSYLSNHVFLLLIRIIWFCNISINGSLPENIENS